MAGKSTILRKTALVVLMAQMGSFVPASKADIGIVDQIFTRVGATDYLSRGQSTFMVEMTETANILNNATPKSLVILDEIGRGTSTYDGLSIAWAVCEHLLFKDGPGIKTMFATHYHELTALEKRHKKVKNMHVEVKEHGNRIYFLHSLKEGATSKSYGIQVAALAGVPDEVIENARSILREIEEKNRGKKTAIPSAAIESSDYKVVVQKTLPLSVDNCDPIREKLLGLNINNTTPLEALNILDKLCKQARKEN
jgi:DNA mismatch repair protein MutS